MLFTIPRTLLISYVRSATSASPAAHQRQVGLYFATAMLHRR